MKCPRRQPTVLARSPSRSTSTPTAAGADMLSRLNFPIRVRILAEHFRRVHRLDVGCGQVERPRIVEPHRVFDDETSLGHITVIRAEALEGSLLECRPYGAALRLALCEQRRVAAEPTTEDRAAGGDRIVDHDPRHV